MKYLKLLKSKYSLSILALAHTPKRDLSKPITRNDLQGSKMLMNFCDSSFAIGESNLDKNIRYIKQIKNRATEKIYDQDNICICEVEKPDNFLGFRMLRFGREKDHLKEHTDKDRTALKEQVANLRKQKIPYRQIGLELGISAMMANRLFKDAKDK